jgi:hypothetical protein
MLSPLRAGNKQILGTPRGARLWRDQGKGDEARPKQKNERTVILKADDQTIILNLGRDGKLQARTSSWEDPKVSRDGDRLESALQQGHGC